MMHAKQVITSSTRARKALEHAMNVKHAKCAKHVLTQVRYLADSINPLEASLAYLYPLKTSKNLKVSNL